MNIRLKRFWASTGERLVKTFVQVYVTTLLLGGLNFEEGTPGTVSQLLQAFSGAEKALVAATAAVLSLVTSLVSKWAGNHNTPSALPASLDPATPVV